MSYLRKFVDSSKELGKITSLALCAMMLALRVVLGIFANISLAFLPLPAVKITFTFIPILITAYLFGPVCAGVVAGAGDILSYIIAPPALPYAPALTACYILEGMIYGVLLYHEELRLSRLIVTKAVDLGLCTLTLHSAVLWFLYFDYAPFYTVVLVRAAVLIPMAAIEIFLMLALKQPLETIQKKIMKA